MGPRKWTDHLCCRRLYGPKLHVQGIWNQELFVPILRRAENWKMEAQASGDALQVPLFAVGGPAPWGRLPCEEGYYPCLRGKPPLPTSWKCEAADPPSAKHWQQEARGETAPSGTGEASRGGVPRGLGSQHEGSNRPKTFQNTGVSRDSRFKTQF